MSEVKLELMVDGRQSIVNTYREMDLEDRIRELGKVGFELSKSHWEVFKIIPSKKNGRAIDPEKTNSKYLFDIEHAIYLRKTGKTTAYIARKYKRSGSWINDQFKKHSLKIMKNGAANNL